jgi:hypothetical protein
VKPSARTRGTDVFDRLALALQQMVRDVHHNDLSGLERYTVVALNPFAIAEVGGELSLEDGDPDFSMGETLRTRVGAGQVSAGDLVWVGRHSGEWHAFDVVSR